MKSPKKNQSTEASLWGFEAIAWEKAIRWLYFSWNKNLVSTAFHFHTNIGGLKYNPGLLVFIVFLEKKKINSKIKSILAILPLHVRFE